MGVLTAYNIVRAINKLPKNRNYNYVNPSNSGLIRIEEVIEPAGPIYIKRWKPDEGKTYSDASREPISSELIWRIANAVTEGDPINFDRVLGGSYNTRSVLEALLAYTPEFYYCYPGRIEEIGTQVSVKPGHKHLVWLPNEPHEEGVLTKKEMPDMAVSEIPLKTITYDSLVFPDGYFAEGFNIEVVRRHTQIQIALYLIGLQLGYKTWIAQNDKGILYKDKPLIEQDGVLPTLSEDNLLASIPGAEPSAKFIDCIWFQNHRFMPAVMEVEHTTGITSGLTRMKGLQDMIPAFNTRYVIVAPDSDRERVIEEVNRPQFKCLNARYFPYSSVEELYYFCTHRNIQGVTDNFLDCYMEEVANL